MTIQVNNKNINIPENIIKQYQEKLELTEDEAIALYLEEERIY